MSAIQFITSGGMANLAGSLPKSDKDAAHEIVKTFNERVASYALNLQIPASFLKIRQCSFLFIAKDIANFHFVFIDAKNSTTISYQDLSASGQIELKILIHQARIQVGEVVWAFSCPLNVTLSELENYIQGIANEYVNTVLQSQHKSDKNISNEAVSSPEIASGLEKFRIDYPYSGHKTAFIIMQFGNTKPHSNIVNCIKETLLKHDIIGLRADDKEYMDDLFANIKTYMHACDFGIAVYERITTEEFNPNVSLEVGYMLGMGKKVLLLKDQTLKSLQSDLTGKLYKQFDTTDINITLPQRIDKWLSDIGFAKK